MDNKPFVPNLPARKEIILDYCRKNRPDIVESVERMLNEHEGISFIASIAFIAGREFQDTHPEVSISQGV